MCLTTSTCIPFLSACIPSCLPESLPVCLHPFLSACVPSCLPASLPVCLCPFPSLCVNYLSGWGESNLVTQAKEVGTQQTAFHLASVASALISTFVTCSLLQLQTNACNHAFSIQNSLLQQVVMYLHEYEQVFFIPLLFFVLFFFCLAKKHNRIKFTIFVFPLHIPVNFFCTCMPVCNC